MKDSINNEISQLYIQRDYHRSQRDLAWATLSDLWDVAHSKGEFRITLNNYKLVSLDNTPEGIEIVRLVLMNWHKMHHSKYLSTCRQIDKIIAAGML